MCSIMKNKVAYLLIVFLGLWALNAQAMFSVRRFSGKRSMPARYIPKISAAPKFGSKNLSTPGAVSMNKARPAVTLPKTTAFFLTEVREVSLNEEENTKLLESQGIEVAKELLALHRNNQTVRTKLFEWAFKRKEKEFAWEVFELGIDVNAPTAERYHPTLLDLTLSGKDLAFPEALLLKGAYPNVMSPIGSCWRPLLCKYLKEPKKVNILTKYGADVNQKDTLGHSALWHIINDFYVERGKTERLESLDFLYDKGLNVHDIDLQLLANAHILEEFKRQGLWRLIEQVKAAASTCPTRFSR